MSKLKISEKQSRSMKKMCNQSSSASTQISMEYKRQPENHAGNQNTL